MRRTKIIATLGPAVSSEDVLEGVLRAGADVVRLNAAHSAIPQLSETSDAVRRVAKRLGSEVAVLVDLPGPKIRLGDVGSGVTLVEGAEFHLLSDIECFGDGSRACVTHGGLWRDVSPGDRILIDDGKIELEVESSVSGDVVTRVVTGGELLAHKGVNVPGVTLSVDTLTEVDERVARWAADSEVDWLGMSFVRGVEDIERLRSIVDGRVPIVAKIEKHEAVADLAAVVESADAVMVARGDLAVETSVEQVPVLQRMIVNEARRAGKPVIVATEMLDSMRTNPRPTRAEASDVANAIFQRADAVMLSGETAVGRHPVDAVATMARIAITAEQTQQPVHAHDDFEGEDVQLAVSAAAAALADDLGAAAIVTVTQSGATAMAVARWRPGVPIVAVTPDERTARRLSLVWGVSALCFPFAENTGDLLDSAVEQVVESGMAESGQRVVLTAGLGSSTPGGTDLIHVRIA